MFCIVLYKRSVYQDLRIRLNLIYAQVSLHFLIHTKSDEEDSNLHPSQTLTFFARLDKFRKELCIFVNCVSV